MKLRKGGPGFYGLMMTSLNFHPEPGLDGRVCLAEDVNIQKGKRIWGTESGGRKSALGPDHTEPFPLFGKPMVEAM